MHPILRMLACMAIVMLLPGCMGNKFKVEFQLDDNEEGAYRMLYYASDSKKGWYVETVADIRNGKGELTGVTHNPTLVFIFRGSNMPAAVFYAERGDKIKITGAGKNPAKWHITGNAESERLSEWRSANADVYDEEMNSAVAKYIKSHPDDGVSALILQLFFNRRISPEQFFQLLGILKGDALDPRWRELTANTDFLTGTPMKEAIAGNIPISTDHGPDTLRFKGKAALLFFTKTGTNDYESTLNEIRIASREKGDSNSRVIAEINIEPDSAARYRSLRRDSIRGVVRAWMPLGFSDPYAGALGLSAIPSVVVKEKNGKIIYSGTDIRHASTLFDRIR